MLWAAIVEPNRDKDRKLEPYTPLDIHPYRSKEDIEEQDDDIEEATPEERAAAEQFCRTLDRIDKLEDDDLVEKLLNRELG